MTGPAFLSRGFRPFFLGASLFAVVGMAAWLAVYLYRADIGAARIPPQLWHAHEMVFGYALAVIAGFLLTATWNWTDQKTADGAGLVAIFLPWAAARVLMFLGDDYLPWATAADLLFLFGLGLAVARPVIRARQGRQATLLAVLLLLMTARLIFQLGVSGVVADGVRIGVHAGLYLVLGMILFMGRRVIPFFTQRGFGYEVNLHNERWNDRVSFLLYPLFVLSEVFLPFHSLGALLAAALFILNSFRVLGWHTVGVWQRPLLWSLFISFVMINLGFMMRALMPVTDIPAYLPVHAFALGGIGIMTLSMMARVSLGHTGRTVHRAPPVMNLLIGGMLAATVLRIFMPLADPGHYRLWVGAAGVAWILSFALFIVVFGPMLVSSRADNEN